MLPDGYTFRAARHEDAAAVADLINACEMLDLGQANTNAARAAAYLGIA